MLRLVQLFATPWTIAYSAPPSLEFSRWEYWTGLPLPTLGDLPNPGIKLTSLVSPVLTSRFFTTMPPGKSLWKFKFLLVISLFLFYLCFPLLEPMFSFNDLFFWNVTCLYYRGQRIIINTCSVSVLELIDTCGMTNLQQNLREVLWLGLTKMQIWYLHSGLWDWGNSDHAFTLHNYLQLIYPGREGNGTPLQDSCLENPWTE